MAETFAFDKLFAGNVMPIVAGAGTVVSGAGALARGTVLGLITASGKLTPVLSSASDGSKDVYCVLAQDVDATSADKTAEVYFTGEFNETALVFGGSDTADTHRVGARKVGIFFKKSIA